MARGRGSRREASSRLSWGDIGEGLGWASGGLHVLSTVDIKGWARTASKYFHFLKHTGHESVVFNRPGVAGAVLQTPL